MPSTCKKNAHLTNPINSEVLELKVSGGRRKGGGERRKKTSSSLPTRRSSRPGRNMFAEIDDLQMELDDGPMSNVESAGELGTGDGGCEGLVSGAVVVGVQVTGGKGHGEEVQGTGERVPGDGEGLQGDSEGEYEGASVGSLQGTEKGAPWSGEGEGSGDQGHLAGGLHGPVEEGNLVAVARGGGVLGPAQGQDLHGLGKFGCTSCDMSFRDTGNLRRHVKLVHTARVVPVKCPRFWCNAEFNILAKMMSHKENCLKVCPYPDCLKQFSKQKHFDAHQRAHLIMARRMSD